MGRSRSDENSKPMDAEFKPYVRAESRPIGKTTYFTCQGDKIDTPQSIGGGKDFKWDFSTTEDDITPSGVNYKHKRLEFQFLDEIHIKEGAIYWKDKLFNSFIDLYVVCPNGEYYIDNSGTPQLATQDTIINHFVNHHFMMGTNYYGDELNTESASNAIPNNYKMWIDIIVPDTDNSSKGNVSLELYRVRTVIL